MAQSITITIQNDTKAVLLLDAFCSRFGYKATIDNPSFDDQLPVDPTTNPLTIPNPESKKAFLKRLTIIWWRETAIHGQAKVDRATLEASFNDTTIIID